MPNLAFPNAATPIGSIPYYAIRFSSAKQRNRLAERYSWLHEIDRIISTIKIPASHDSNWTGGIKNGRKHSVAQLHIPSRSLAKKRCQETRLI